MESIKLDCGHYSEPTKTSPGYGSLPSGHRFCFSCCAEMERDYMKKHGRNVLYLAKDEKGYYKVTDWPGKLSIPVLCLKDGRHNIAGTRKDVWFKFDGFIWHGVNYGANSQLTHCRKTKKTTM